MDVSGRTPLHNAAISGTLQIVKLLLDYKADPNLKDSTGATVLHYACKCPVDNSEVLKLLLKRQEIQGKDISNSNNFLIFEKILN